jgi:class 3 adenylate cyclase
MDAPPIQYARTEDGVNIAYSAMGDGPPLVMSDGSFLGLATGWGDAAERLARSFRVYRFDSRGSGASQRDVTSVSEAAQAKDVAAIFDLAEASALVGFSHGSHAALQYAATHPERIQHLVIYGSPGPYQTRRSEEQLEFDRTLDAMVQQALERGQPFAQRALLMMMMPTAPPELLDRLVDELTPHLKAETTLSYIKASRASTIEETLPDASMPVLILHQQHDPLESFDGAMALAALLPNATVQPLAGKDHLFQRGQPQIEAFARAIESFILGQEWSGAEAGTLTRTRTLLFTDLESSTALTQAVGDAKAQEVLRGHNDAVRAALANQGGEEVKHTGDGIFAAFGSAVSAVEASLQIQRDLAGGEVRVRIGLNAGEPIAEDGDYFGSAVQLAARVCDRAEPGQVLVSNVVKELCSGKLFRFQDQGEATLKGFPEPVRLFVVGEGA